MKFLGAAMFALMMGAGAFLPGGPLSSAKPAEAALADACNHALSVMVTNPDTSENYKNASYFYLRYC